MIEVVDGWWRLQAVISRCSAETAKRRLTQTTPHDSPGSFLVSKISAKLKRGHLPQRRRKMQVDRLNAGEVAENRRPSTRSVVILGQSHVYHTERTPARSGPPRTGAGPLRESLSAPPYSRPLRSQ